MINNPKKEDGFLYKGMAKEPKQSHSNMVAEFDYMIHGTEFKPANENEAIKMAKAINNNKQTSREDVLKTILEIKQGLNVAPDVTKNPLDFYEITPEGKRIPLIDKFLNKDAKQENKVNPNSFQFPANQEDENKRNLTNDARRKMSMGGEGR